MTDVILKELGTVDKYIGDALMAFWNAPLDDPAHGFRVRSALQMRQTLVKLNAEWKERAEKADRPVYAVKFGIGLSTGVYGVGNMGSIQRFKLFPALGDEGQYRYLGSKVRLNSSASTSLRARLRATKRSVFAWLEIDHVRQNKTRNGRVLLAGRGLCRRRRVQHLPRAARGYFESLPGARISPLRNKWRLTRPNSRQRHSGALPLLSPSVSRNWAGTNCLRPEADDRPR